MKTEEWLFRLAGDHRKMLALAGGLLGLLFGMWLGNWLRSLLPETYLGLPLRFDLALDKRTFTFTLAISVLTGALSGIAPALGFSRLDLIPVLKGLPGRRSGAGRIKLREGLVVAQVALSFALLVAAALCVRKRQNTRAIASATASASRRSPSIYPLPR